ncbi:hypothetical protein Tco_0473926 [Tanacetum coccineum]
MNVIGVTATELLTTVRHHLVLPVQVNAAEGGTDCLPTATIFEELARMGFLDLEEGKGVKKFKESWWESRRVESSEDNDSLVGRAQEDASKQGRSLEDIDKDAKVSLADET